MDIKIVHGYEYKDDVKSLFSEYTSMLIENESDFKDYLKIQNYDDELENLQLKYGLPDGRIYLVYCDEILAGCIALRKIDDNNCEMKRLYVKPDFRGQHMGKVLVDRIIEDAKEIGYKHMLLDTFPFLKTAIQIYENCGFYEIPSYNNSPMDGLVYMKLDL